MKNVVASNAVSFANNMKEMDFLRRQDLVHTLASPSSIFELLCKVIVSKNQNVSSGFQAIQNNIVTAIDSGDFQTTLKDIATNNNATLLLSVNVSAVDFTIVSVYTAAPTFSPTIKSTAAKNSVETLANGALAGIIVGALVLCLIVATIVILLWCRKKDKVYTTN